MPVSRIIRHRHLGKETKICNNCRVKLKTGQDLTLYNGYVMCMECKTKRKYGLCKSLIKPQHQTTESKTHNSLTIQNNHSVGMTTCVKSTNNSHNEIYPSSKCVNVKADILTPPFTLSHINKLKALVLVILAMIGPLVIVNDVRVTYRKENNYHSNPFERHWREPDIKTLNKYSSDICSIDKIYVDEITESEFNLRYRQKHPVIIRFRNGASDWTNVSKWLPSSLITDYGSHTLYSGESREIVRNGGNGDIGTSLEYYVNSFMAHNDSHSTTELYVFDRMFYRNSKLYITPPSFLNMTDGIDDSMFFLGPSKSGVSFHKHAEGWNAVVFGKKRWFLYPKSKMPPGGMYPGYSQLDWYYSIYPALSEEDKPIECIQNEGEIMYLPESMYHSTINLGDTIAVGIQKIQATSSEETLFYKDNELVRQGEHLKRLSILKELQLLVPENGEVYLKLGQVYEELSDLKSSEFYYQKAIELDSFFLVAFLNMARIKSKLNEKETADEVFRHVINLNPNMWDIYAEYGTFLIEENRFSEAIDIFQKGCELQPTMSQFWDYLRYCQESVGDWDGARRSKEQISKLEKQAVD